MKVKLNGNDWYEVTSDFAEINSTHLTPHTGIDLSMPEGTELYSPVKGVVEDIVNYGDENIGKGLLIRTEERETLILGHLSDTKVEVGDYVDVGDLVALSGNTGSSTGAHLHLGLKNMEGYFLDPNKYTDTWESLAESYKLINLFPTKRGSDVKILENGEIIGNADDLLTKPDNIFEFISNWRENGFFHAVYGDSFFNVMKGFFAELFHDIGVFILGNGDVFFLAPAIILMFGTFFVGRNKFSKWIIPLWFTYFLSSFFHKLLIS